MASEVCRVKRPVPHRRAWWAAFALCGVLLLAWPGGAQAQINPFVNYNGPVMDKEDLDAWRAAAGKLLIDDKAEIGKSEDWAGAMSGNRGTLSVVKRFQRQGMECRAVKSTVRYKKTPTSPQTMTLNTCQTKDGEWKLM